MDARRGSVSNQFTIKLRRNITPPPGFLNEGATGVVRRAGPGLSALYRPLPTLTTQAPAVKAVHA